MNVTSFVIEQALKRLGVSKKSILQLQIAGKLSDVNGNGFPAELFQLSAPMVTRGLLNFAILQMKPDWVYPYWINKQLNPNDVSFIARSQNPLLINTTHRNWTMIGSINGFHEAIVDPTGLVTPLPREWSVDVWIISENEFFLPSHSYPINQIYNTDAPIIITKHKLENFILETEAFVDSIKQNTDVLFQSVKLTNKTNLTKFTLVCVAIRPFNPEGVAPIRQIEFKNLRHYYIDKSIGVVFDKEPAWVYCTNCEKGDAVNTLRGYYKQQNLKGLLNAKSNTSVECPNGLANSVAIFPFDIEPDEVKSIHLSIALADEKKLRTIKAKSTWRVSFEKRCERHQLHWNKERSTGAQILLNDERLQKIFDANILALLQLQDGEFVSPGPYLYHHFWFRDAVPILFALDRAGYQRRVQRALDSFYKRQTKDGFFRGPDGEWDSNGAVIWLIEKHYNLVRSATWLKHVFPFIQKGMDWIIKKRVLSKETASTHKGLLPPSLSAEHFGTVDQYYWDSFWSLAGMRSAINLAKVIRNDALVSVWEREENDFSDNIIVSLEKSSANLGENLIPASPMRKFDESAIGFVSGIYPLEIDNINPELFNNTLNVFTNRYVTDDGFYHPIIHSGYNPYLTLHLAHAYLFKEDYSRAWKLADSIFNKCNSPYSLPEAIHPKTGGGAMGDGHHGWAAAEIILYILDCLVQEKNEQIYIFKGIKPDMLYWGKDCFIKGIATSFGQISCEINFETSNKALLYFKIVKSWDDMPKSISIFLPFSLQRVLPITSNVNVNCEMQENTTRITFCSSDAMLLLER